MFDTYVYTKGMTQAQYSYSAAVGLFKSAVGLVLVLGPTGWPKNSEKKGSTEPAA